MDRVGRVGETQRMATHGDQDPSDADEARGLTLYGYPQCPYCRRVLDTMDSLGLEIPLRNTLENPDWRSELLAAVGRGTVPVLLIEDADGKNQWLPESADIVRYLKDRFE